MAIIESIILKRIFNEGLNSVQKSLKNRREKISFNRNDYESGISKHIEKINSWSSRINFKDLNNPKSTIDLFVELEYFDNLKSTNVNPSKTGSKKNIYEILSNSNFHIALYGEPGSGKTTTVKMLIQNILASKIETSHSFPLLITLRDLNRLNESREYSDSGYGVLKYLYKELNIIITDTATNKEVVNFDDPVYLNIRLVLV